MKTMEEVTARSEEINQRFATLMCELKEAKGSPEKAIKLAEELATLLHEAKTITNNIAYFNHVREMLLNERCSGPH
jgi:hypothetical protein